MKDKELKLNASGYKDEPCYKTIKAVDVPKPGEIYIHGDTGRYVLVLNHVNGVCAILNLTEQEREDRIPIMVRVKMYTNHIMITYAFTSVLAQYVKTITDEEFENVKRGIVKMLGLQDACNFMKKVEIAVDNLLKEDNESDALEEKVKALEEERDKMFTALGHANKELIKMTDERDTAESERDAAMTVADQLHAENIDASIQLEKEKVKSQFYREMYDTLLDKLISDRGKA